MVYKLDNAYILLITLILFFLNIEVWIIMKLKLIAKKKIKNSI